MAKSGLFQECKADLMFKNQSVYFIIPDIKGTKTAETDLKKKNIIRGIMLILRIIMKSQ